MIFIDNIYKGWNTGQYLGDLILGHATAIPGFVLDLSSMPTAAEYRYTTDLNYSEGRRDVTRSNYMAQGRPSFSRLFAAPGKLVGNTVVPLVSAIIAATVFFPNAVIRLVDEFYQTMKDKIDEAMTFLAECSTNNGNLSYMEKSFFAGKTLLGNLGGAIISSIGMLIDGLCALVSVNTDFAATKIAFKAGADAIGFIGGIIMGTVSAALYPVKKILDSVSYVYRGISNTLDNIAAFCMNRNRCNPNVTVDSDKYVYNPQFQERLRVMGTLSFVEFIRYLFSSRNRPALRGRAAERAATELAAAERAVVERAAEQAATEQLRAERAAIQLERAELAAAVDQLGAEPVALQEAAREAARRARAAVVRPGAPQAAARAAARVEMHVREELPDPNNTILTENAAPRDYRCPITKEIMRDPVIVSTGHTFERTAIERCLQTHSANPLTGAYLDNRILTPNIALRQAITAFNASATSLTEEAPHSYYCLLTKKIMIDPVMTKSGLTFERTAIAERLQHNNTNPRTNERLTSNDPLIPNIALKGAIVEWNEANPTPAAPAVSEEDHEPECDPVSFEPFDDTAVTICAFGHTVNTESLFQLRATPKYLTSCYIWR